MPEPNKEIWLKKNPLNSINLPIFPTVWEAWTENTSECSARPILDLTISTSRIISQLFWLLWLMQTTILQLQMVHMDVKENLMYVRSQISGSVSMSGNWICLVTSPYRRMTQEMVLQFLMSCLETRILACQRNCCNHILPKIYFMKRGHTTTDTPEPDALWSVPLEF